MNPRTFNCLLRLAWAFVVFLLLSPVLCLVPLKIIIDQQMQEVPPRVNFLTEKLPSIKLGMTKDELIAHLGKPPGEYQSGPIGPTNPPLLYLGEPVRNDVKRIKWSDDAAELYVAFDADGKLIYAFATTTALLKKPKAD